MSNYSPTIRVRADVTNPGHYFACCGMAELASRAMPPQNVLEPESWFENEWFLIAKGPSLKDLVGNLTNVELKQTNPLDATASPIEIKAPFCLLLDWWKAGDRASSDLKVWAGTMESFRIAKAMQAAMKAPEFLTENLLNIGTVAYDPDNPEKKVEPFYFDARRGPNAHSRDVGFAPNDLGMTTIGSPAVELLCLIGLQRVRPISTGKPRVFDYHTWTRPLPSLLLPAAAAGLLPDAPAQRYRFESWYRTGQRKHKAFLSAKLQSKTAIS